MSMHKIPLTPIEEAGLHAHGLQRDIGKPSQLVDVFRQGVAWGIKSERDALQGQVAGLRESIAEINRDAWSDDNSRLRSIARATDRLLADTATIAADHDARVRNEVGK